LHKLQPENPLIKHRIAGQWVLPANVRWEWGMVWRCHWCSRHQNAFTMAD